MVEEPGTVPLRPVVIVAAVLLLGAVGYLGYSCTRASGAGDSFSAPLGRYPRGTVTYLAAARTYLVRQEEGSFLALSEVEASPEDRVAGCLIRYRADLSAADQTGVFRDDCHGTLFNREGVAVQGTSPAIQRHPVRVEGDEVAVRFKSCVAGGGSDAPEPCRE